ncbi:MAG: rhamnogalacturonan acetylesterase [Xanthomonadales bacterium]|nr:rhamnogalacturonan acetylesterase [Xanthomonadales bacterium]
MAPKLAKKRPETGWGEMLPGWFDAKTVVVKNHARNGRSTRTFIEQGRWQALLEITRPGDYVFIQFGHNDQSKRKVDRYTPPEQYRANLERFVAEVRERRAIPVLMTPVVRRRFDESGAFYDSHGDYPDDVRQVAESTGTTLLDMENSSREVLRARGAEESKSLYLWLAPGAHANYPDGLQDNTHFSPKGARVMATVAVSNLRASGLPLADLLRDKAVRVEPVAGDFSGDP